MVAIQSNGDKTETGVVVSHAAKHRKHLYSPAQAMICRCLTIVSTHFTLERSYSGGTVLVRDSNYRTELALFSDRRLAYRHIYLFAN